MTVEALQEVQPGKPLGEINLRGPEGELIRKVGDLSEGVIPESAVVSSGSTHAYIATSRVPGIGTEELVIELEQSGPNEPIIEIGARVRESGKPIGLDVDPELLEAALKLAMARNGIVNARLGKSSTSSLPETIAKTFKLQEDEAGAHIVKPPSQPPAVVPSSTW
jgi:hypothetical protein